MDLRNLSKSLFPAQRCEERRRMLEQGLSIDLSALAIDPENLGHAEAQNCEQMFGHVPIPVGYAGPLPVTFSSGATTNIHLPLATTEGALVASVNRGCKALRMSGGVRMVSVYHGVSRSMAFRMKNEELRMQNYCEEIQRKEREWKAVGEATSSHLKILTYDIDTKDDYLFLTIHADTDEAMGMNMVTIAAEAIGKWMEQNIGHRATPMDPPAMVRDDFASAKSLTMTPADRHEGQHAIELVTVAANVDSDKKPSTRTHDRGRGYEVTATATVSTAVLCDVLKTTPEALLEVAHTKLDLGSALAGALGRNCHAANVIAALYLATGQDPAHVVEGSLADTIISLSRRERVRVRGSDAIIITTRLPALLVGIRGGGTTLPAQQQCLNILLQPITYPSASSSGPRGNLQPRFRLAESVGAAVLAGELSLLAALSSHKLGKAHQSLGRVQKRPRAQTVQQ